MNKYWHPRSSWKLNEENRLRQLCALCTKCTTYVVLHIIHSCVTRDTEQNRNRNDKSIDDVVVVVTRLLLCHLAFFVNDTQASEDNFVRLSFYAFVHVCQRKRLAYRITFTHFCVCTYDIVWFEDCNEWWLQNRTQSKLITLQFNNMKIVGCIKRYATCSEYCGQSDSIHTTQINREKKRLTFMTMRCRCYSIEWLNMQNTAEDV